MSEDAQVSKMWKVDISNFNPIFEVLLQHLQNFNQLDHSNWIDLMFMWNSNKKSTTSLTKAVLPILLIWLRDPIFDLCSTHFKDLQWWGQNKSTIYVYLILCFQHNDFDLEDKKHSGTTTKFKNEELETFLNRDRC